MKFTLAPLSRSSTPMRTPTALRRVATVTRPKQNSSAPTARKCGSDGWSMDGASGLVGLELLAGHDHGADEGGEQDEGGQLEGEQPLLQEGVADGGGGLGERRLGADLPGRAHRHHQQQRGGGQKEQQAP